MLNSRNIFSRANEDYKFLKHTLGNHGTRGFNIITGGPTHLISGNDNN